MAKDLLIKGVIVGCFALTLALASVKVPGPHKSHAVGTPAPMQKQMVAARF